MFKITNAILGDEEIVIPVSNYDSENDVYISTTCVIGRDGIVQRIYIDLNEEEYLEYNSAIMESIYENYLPVDATIVIDRELNRLNKEIELNVTQSLADTNEMDYGNLFNKLVDEYGWPKESAKKLVEDCKNAKSRSFKAIAEANFDAKILPLIDHYVEVLESEGMDSQKFLKDIKKYLLARTPYDFYYAGKDNISNIR